MSGIKNGFNKFSSYLLKRGGAGTGTGAVGGAAGGTGIKKGARATTENSRATETGTRVRTELIEDVPYGTIENVVVKGGDGKVDVEKKTTRNEAAKIKEGDVKLQLDFNFINPNSSSNLNLKVKEKLQQEWSPRVTSRFIPKYWLEVNGKGEQFLTKHKRLSEITEKEKNRERIHLIQMLFKKKHHLLNKKDINKILNKIIKKKIKDEYIWCIIKDLIFKNNLQHIPLGTPDHNINNTLSPIHENRCFFFNKNFDSINVYLLAISLQHVNKKSADLINFLFFYLHHYNTNIDPRHFLYIFLFLSKCTFKEIVVKEELPTEVHSIEKKKNEEHISIHGEIKMKNGVVVDKFQKTEPKKSDILYWSATSISNTRMDQVSTYINGNSDISMFVRQNYSYKIENAQKNLIELLGIYCMQKVNYFHYNEIGLVCEALCYFSLKSNPFVHFWNSFLLHMFGVKSNTNEQLKTTTDANILKNGKKENSFMEKKLQKMKSSNNQNDDYANMTARNFVSVLKYIYTYRFTFRGNNEVNNNENETRYNENETRHNENETTQNDKQVQCISKVSKIEHLVKQCRIIWKCIYPNVPLYECSEILYYLHLLNAMNVPILKGKIATYEQELNNIFLKSIDLDCLLKITQLSTNYIYCAVPFSNIFFFNLHKLSTEQVLTLFSYLFQVHKTHYLRQSFKGVKTDTPSDINTNWPNTEKHQERNIINTRKLNTERIDTNKKEVSQKQSCQKFHCDIASTKWNKTDNLKESVLFKQILSTCSVPNFEQIIANISFEDMYILLYFMDKENCFTNSLAAIVVNKIINTVNNDTYCFISNSIYILLLVELLHKNGSAVENLLSHFSFLYGKKLWSLLIKCTTTYSMPVIMLSFFTFSTKNITNECLYYITHRLKLIPTKHLYNWIILFFFRQLQWNSNSFGGNSNHANNNMKNKKKKQKKKQTEKRNKRKETNISLMNDLVVQHMFDKFSCEYYIPILGIPFFKLELLKNFLQLWALSSVDRPGRKLLDFLIVFSNFSNTNVSRYLFNERIVNLVDRYFHLIKRKKNKTNIFFCKCETTRTPLEISVNQITRINVPK